MTRLGILLTSVAILAGGLYWQRVHGSEQPQLRPSGFRGKWRSTAPAWLQSPPPAEAINGLRVYNWAGEAQPDRPLTISRFFAQGEIKEFARAIVNGQPLQTQCDVKTRWADGSLQHALISFRATLPKDAPLLVTFDNQPTGNNDGQLEAVDMLSDRFDLGAEIELRNADSVQKVNVRDILQAGAFRYWIRGPICTQVIVEDAGTRPAFDLGFGSIRSFHPIYILTFYPGHRGVKVDFIGENAWFDRLQDLTYSLALRTGHPLKPEPDYQRANFTHIPRSRWRKTFWSGPELKRINIDFNLPYLIYSRAVPNFDLSRVVSPAAIQQEITAFGRSDRGDLGGNGQLQRTFPATGGRPDIGLYTRWDVRYLYTFHPELESIVMANAGVSGHIPIHVRESRSGRPFHAASGDADALGRTVSVDSRPGYCSRNNGEFATPGDRITFVGTNSTQSWQPDLAHQPSFTYIAYLTTGDWYFLEEMYFWASWNIAYTNAGNCTYCRGGLNNLDGSYGFIYPSTNVRGYAWGLRTAAHAALLAPIGSPERAYFTEKVIYNIAIHEGRFDIKDGVAVDESLRPMWRFGRDVYARSVPNALYWWQFPNFNNIPAADVLTDSSKAFHVNAPWQQNFIYIVLGHMEEQGFPTTALRRKTMENLADQLLDPDYNRYLVDAYYVPVSGELNVFYTSWAQVMEGTAAAERNRKTWVSSRVGDAEHGYGYIALAASSFLADVDKGDRKGIDGWTWFKENYPRQDVLNDNPKWAFLPRWTPSTASSPVLADRWAKQFQQWRTVRASK